MKIKRLSVQEASKIAAGEVIDRPAHVVKELLENALDAGATAITLYLEKAGKRLIRIVDNGCGMSADDAQLCFAHHSTSKISNVNDLTKLTTFGFRGEALASIAAVSRVQLLTKQAQDAIGTQIIQMGQDALSVTETACNTGTDITITELFDSIPVRKKFLRTDETEWSQIQQLLYAIALSHQQVHFKVYVDNKLRYNCPVADSIRLRLEQLWGYELYSMHTIEVMQEGIRIQGAITDTHHLRYDRSHMYLFVNNRWIKNQSLLRAWLNGYQNILPAGKYPAGVLCLTLDPQVIDVNIHPRKEEILFLNPRFIEQCITQTVKNALQQGLQENLKKAQMPPMMVDVSVPINPLPMYNQPIVMEKIVESANKPLPIYESSAPVSFVSSPHQIPAPMVDTQESITTVVDTAVPFYKIIGQFNTTYILLETEKGLLLVDQHAAHERILYQQCKTNMANVVSIPLMFPTVIPIAASDIQKLEPYLFLFEQQGIGLRILGANQLHVLSCPVIGKSIDWHDFIAYILSWIVEHEQLSVADMQHQLLHAMHAQIACKAAVKAGDVLTTEQMQQLIKDLYNCVDHLTCPHGRPTCFLMSEQDIKKKFKRDYKR